MPTSRSTAARARCTGETYNPLSLDSAVRRLDCVLESETLRQQAVNNTKEQFANSPDLKTELPNAIMGALDALTAMSTQALNSENVQRGITDILLNNAGLYESLRDKRAG